MQLTSLVLSFFFFTPCSSTVMSSSSLVGDWVISVGLCCRGWDLSLPIWRADGRKEEIEESIGIR